MILHGATEEQIRNVNKQIENIINGTATVGNAEKLGGKEPSEYASSTTNMLNITMATLEHCGITCTANGNGTYTLNGTATEEEQFRLNTNNPFIFKAGITYRIVGCPSGGSWNETYALYLGDNEVIDEGEGATVTYDTERTGIARITFRAGTVFNNITFKPMITTNLNATIDDFVPYTGSTGALNTDVAETRKDLNKIILNETKNVYVSPSGSDETGDGTQEKPWRTIQKAVDECPLLISTGAYCIYLDNGVYDEDINVRSRRIYIYATNAENSDITVGSLRLSNSCVDIVTPLTFDVSNRSVAWGIHSTYSYLNANSSELTLVGSGSTSYGVFSGRSTVVLSKTNISGFNNAVCSAEGGICYVYNAIISNSGYGLYTVGGVIRYGQATFTSVTSQFVTSNGGRIYTGAQSNMGKY